MIEYREPGEILRELQAEERRKKSFLYRVMRPFHEIAAALNEIVVLLRQYRRINDTIDRGQPFDWEGGNASMPGGHRRPGE